MFCENCGNKIDKSHKFCTKCGHSSASVTDLNEKQPTLSGDKWWHRTMKVIYIALYIPLPFTVVIVWIENSSSYSSRYGYSGSTWEAFWYSLLTLITYIIAIRIIKITFFYIVYGKKPKWKKEFKKFF